MDDQTSYDLGMLESQVTTLKQELGAEVRGLQTLIRDLEGRVYDLEHRASER